jgi:hypothetical protein
MLFPKWKKITRRYSEGGAAQGAGTDPAENNQDATTAGAGNQTAGAQGTSSEPNTPFKTFTTQKDFDDHAGAIRNAAKTKALDDFCKENDIDPANIAEMKSAWENSKTAEEKAAEERVKLNDRLELVTSESAAKDLRIATLTALVNSTGIDADKIIKMAAGLVDENTTAEAAVKQVLEMTKSTANTPETDDALPKGVELLQPDGKQNGVANPWCKETWDLDAQGRIFRENKDTARALAKAAGEKVTW